MIVAIHQPNYAPWAGYFHKIARADVFVFLDDAQFPKNSYVNRVKILEKGEGRWLTVPAKPKLGAPINAVRPAQADWPARHLDRLFNAYRSASAFDEVWGFVEHLYRTAPADDLAAANRRIVEGVAERLQLRTRFALASDYPNPDGLRSDARLIDLVTRLGADVYLSGRGGASYQDPLRFEEAGLRLSYTEFELRPYPQLTAGFTAGLSILDQLFHCGFQATAADVLTIGASE